MDGHAHVRLAELGLHAAVDELDHRVNDALRVNHDVDGVVRHGEEEVRLDDLERLVHHGGGIDRDPRAHVPGRVRQRLCRRDRGELASRPAPERAARCRQQDAPNRSGRLADQALPDGRMLRVDRDDLGPGAPRCIQQQPAPRNQALLVGEGQSVALLERSHRRGQARRADDAVDDDGVRVRRQLEKRLLPRPCVARVRRQRCWVGGRIGSHEHRIGP